MKQINNWINKSVNKLINELINNSIENLIWIKNNGKEHEQEVSSCFLLSNESKNEWNN